MAPKLIMEDRQMQSEKRFAKRLEAMRAIGTEGTFINHSNVDFFVDSLTEAFDDRLRKLTIEYCGVTRTGSDVETFAAALPCCTALEELSVIPATALGALPTPPLPERCRCARPSACWI